jgi:signal transduction histidine kinase
MRAKDSIEARGQSKQLQLVADQDKEHEQDLLVAQDSFNARIRLYIVIGTAGVFLLVGLILWRGYNRQKHNNRLLSEQKEEIATQRDHLEATLEKLKSTQTQLIQSEKMASLGELTAGIAHEIQNPLNFVNNFSEVSVELLDELTEEAKAGHTEDVMAIAGDLTQNLEKIRHHGKRADAIVKGMLQHSQSGSGIKAPANLNALADEYLRLSYHGLRSKDKSFNAETVTHFDEDLPLINVIPQDIGRVMLNLFNNAFYAVNQKQKMAGNDYKPEVSVSTSTEKNNLVINVRDNGIGIPDAIKEKIMQPFFTTKPTGEGTGLGLSLTYDMVVKGHGGTIRVNSVEGEGSEFIITLPVA